MGERPISLPPQHAGNVREGQGERRTSEGHSRFRPISAASHKPWPHSLLPEACTTSADWSVWRQSFLRLRRNPMFPERPHGSLMPPCQVATHAGIEHPQISHVIFMGMMEWSLGIAGSVVTVVWPLRHLPFLHYHLHCSPQEAWASPLGLCLQLSGSSRFPLAYL